MHEFHRPCLYIERIIAHVHILRLKLIYCSSKELENYLAPTQPFVAEVIHTLICGAQTWNILHDCFNFSMCPIGN